MHIDEASADIYRRARFRIRTIDAGKARCDVGDRSRSPIPSDGRCGVVERTVSTCRDATGRDLPARETIAIAVRPATSCGTAMVANITTPSDIATTCDRRQDAPTLTGK
ncbi:MULTISPECIES: hypothetical protein [Burkholderia]|uniref:hypothetical protein n=1 Tax=Burkholderia TaxID=32008 RepID=UPI000AB99010|nr:MULTISPECIES: hypothetical protein [Burkholderia]